MAKASDGGTALAPEKTAPDASKTPPQAGNGEWRTGLPEDLRGSASLAKYNTVADLAKGHIETEKLLGSRIPVPGPDAKDADWNEIWTKMGRPPDAKGYKLPQGVEFDADSQTALQGFMGKMHAAGLTQKQMDAAVGWYAENETARIQEELAADAAEHQASVAALKTEWGQEYDAKVALARQAVMAFGGEKLAAWMNETGLGDDQTLIRAFAAAGKLVSEDSIRGKGGMQTSNPQQEAEAKIKEKEMDKDFMDALRDRANPRHENVLQEWKRLMKAAYPGEVTI